MTMSDSTASARAVHTLIEAVRAAGQATPAAVRALESFRDAGIDVDEAGSTLAAALSDGMDAATDASSADGALAPLVTTGAIAMFAPRICEAALRTRDTLDRILSLRGDALAAASHVTAIAASSPSLRTWLKSTRAVEQLLGRTASDEITIENASATLLRIKVAIRSSDTPGTPLELSPEESEKIARGLATSIAEAPTQDANAPNIFSFNARDAGRADALEGLYYLAALDGVKELLSADAAFLAAAVAILNANTPRKSLFPARDGAAPTTSLYDDDALDREEHPQASLEFLVVSIIALVAAYPPQKSGESQQIAALRRTALRRGEDTLDAANSAARCRRLVEARVSSAVAAVVARTRLADAVELRRQLGSILCSLVTEQDKAQRGQLLADGVAGALLQLATHAYAGITENNESPLDWFPLQAIARLTISSDPALMYGSGTARGVPYCAALLLARSTSTLDRFEGTMALTNLASTGPAMARAVATASFRGPDSDSELRNVGSAVPALFLQYDVPLLRRALVELLCNLVQDDGMFAEWSGEAAVDEDDRKRAAGEPLPRLPDKEDKTIRLHDPRGRLQLIASLCYVDAEADRVNVEEARAAAGALAMLSASGAACEHILALPSRTHEVIAQLVWREVPQDKMSKDDALQLALRGLTIVSSLVQYVQWLDTHKEGRSGVRRRVRDPAGALQRSGLLQAAAKRAVDGAQALMAQMGATATGAEGLAAQVTSLAVDVMRDAASLMR